MSFLCVGWMPLGIPHTSVDYSDLDLIYDGLYHYDNSVVISAMSQDRINIFYIYLMN